MNHYKNEKDNESAEKYRLIEKDKIEAFEYYKESAENGYHPAQNVVGHLYENGQGIEKDLGKAIGWYKKAVANGTIQTW